MATPAPKANHFIARTRPGTLRDVIFSPAPIAAVVVIITNIVFLAIVEYFQENTINNIVLYVLVVIMTIGVAARLYDLSKITDVSGWQLQRWSARSLSLTWIIEDLSGAKATRINDTYATSLIDNNSVWYELSWGDGQERFSSPLGDHSERRMGKKTIYSVNLRETKSKHDEIHHITTSELRDAFCSPNEWVSAYSLYSSPNPFKMCVIFPRGAKVSNPYLEYYRGGMRHIEKLELSNINDRIAIVTEIKNSTPRNMYYIKWSWNQKIQDGNE